MDKIKPEVIGWVQVFSSGMVSDTVFFRIESITHLIVDEEVELHKNGKPKVRPVYKKDVS